MWQLETAKKATSHARSISVCIAVSHASLSPGVISCSHACKGPIMSPGPFGNPLEPALVGPVGPVVFTCSACVCKPTLSNFRHTHAGKCTSNSQQARSRSQVKVILCFATWVECSLRHFTRACERRGDGSQQNQHPRVLRWFAHEINPQNYRVQCE